MRRKTSLIVAPSLGRERGHQITRYLSYLGVADVLLMVVSFSSTVFSSLGGAPDARLSSKVAESRGVVVTPVQL